MEQEQVKEESREQTEWVTVRINGKEVRVPRTLPDPIDGHPVPTTILQACEIAGVHIPHLCYHPKLRPAGNCRMCLVEYGLPAMGPDRKPILDEQGRPVIRKAPRPVTACTTPITPGMEIYTDTPEVRKMRQAVLELLLANHPLDCPICDKAGECLLQEYVFDYGAAQSRFEEVKIHKPKAQRIGPRLIFDAERCILCGRCIRFLRDVVGDDCLGIVNRGGTSTLAVYPGRQVDNNYSLNLVDLCPVGALTSVDFRFRMRVWFLKETKSICGTCGRGCNILVGSREGRIYRLTPRRNDAVNQCWLCDEGRLNYKWVHREDRLRQPWSRRSGATDWDTVLQEVVEILRRAPSGSVAIVASARFSCEELFLVRKLADALGAVTDCVPRLGEEDGFLVVDDRNPNSNGARITGVSFTEIGIQLPMIAYGIETGRIRTLLVFGEDVTGEEEIGEGPLQSLENLIVSDVLPSRTTELAHIVLPGAAYFEKAGTWINVDGRVQRFWKAIDPPGAARPEIQWLARLVKELTGQEWPTRPSELFDRMCREVPALRGLSWQRIGDEGISIEI